MIGRLQGLLAAKNPPQVLIDCHGVGYDVDVPMSTFYNLPGLGEQVTLLTHFVVREDAQILYGFATPGERDAFLHVRGDHQFGKRRTHRVVRIAEGSLVLNEIFRFDHFPDVVKISADATEQSVGSNGVGGVFGQ